MIFMDNYTMFMREMYDPKDSSHFHDSNNNFIHETANVGSTVRLGKNNYIGAFCNIVGDTKIGDNNHFEAYCSIGTYPEHREFFEMQSKKGVVIGNNNVFREFITINAGTVKDTVLESNIWMLRNSHIGHDSLIRESCTISCNVLIGGHSILGKWVNMGLGSICHQFSVLGSGSMLGMGCIITKKTPIRPFETYVGNPAKLLKANEHRISKMTEDQISHGHSLYQEDLITIKKLTQK
ncbi:MAG: hypothetical protein FJY17_00880 [Bacteroidetes bacterium]|nr:hypothetical protein [Bacteroidota bacterium]